MFIVGQGHYKRLLAYSSVEHMGILALAFGVGGSALNVDAIARNLMQTRRTVADIISAHTGKSLEEVLDKTASDSYFDAGEAVEWGLADRVIHQL